MSRLRRPSSRSFLALGGGVLVAASLPPWGVWPLAFAGVIVFELALGAAPDRGTRFRCAWMFAAGWLFPGMVWMWFLTPPGYIVATALFAAFHGVAAMAAPTGRWRIIARPAAHTLAEALRFCFPFGGVPLASLAISQSAGPVVGVVRIGGAVLLTWITFQIGFALAGVIVARVSRSPARRSNTLAPSGVGLVAVIAVLAIAVVAPSGHATGRALRVAVVQGGGPQGTHAIHTDSRLVLERHLAATRLLQPSDDLDVVVWPENVIDVPSFSDSPELAEVAAEAERLHATFLVGVTEDRPGDRFTNAQVVVTPDGQYTDRYDKVRRVPFGEYMPLRGLLEALGAPTNLVPRNAIAGTDPAYLALPDGTRLGVVISWEVFFGGRGRDGVSHGGQLIINPTNGSSYTWTVLQTQQVASSRLRAIETGRWVAQAAPTGFSAFISPEGVVHDRTSVSKQAVLIRSLALRSGNTWYVTLGDKPWVALVLAVLLASMWAAGWRPRRRARPAPAEVDDGRTEPATAPAAP
jgi:apolipoprotein N-acyltransferase